VVEFKTDTVFQQLGETVGGNQVLFSAAKPVFVSYGFDVRSVRVYVLWATFIDIVIVTVTQRDGPR
jgi:hypothetical protein